MTKEKAKAYATKAHEGQTRKTNGTPMIEHPIRVAEMLEAYGFSDEAVMAGYLHDTVEDTYVTLEDIRREFGEKVAAIVSGNTEQKDRSWEERKLHTIEWIKTAPLEVKALIVADKLDNLRTLMEGFETLGESLWSHFKRGREKQSWYFKGVANNCCFGLSEDEAPEYFHVYRKEVNSFFK